MLHSLTPAASCEEWARYWIQVESEMRTPWERWHWFYSKPALNNHIFLRNDKIVFMIRLGSSMVIMCPNPSKTRYSAPGIFLARTSIGFLMDQSSSPASKRDGHAI